MADGTEVITPKDPHQFLHRLMPMGVFWLGISPAATVMSYLTSDTKVPVYLHTPVTAAATVPLMTNLVVPHAKSLISSAIPKA